jgi:hypothetical protein
MAMFSRRGSDIIVRCSPPGWTAATGKPLGADLLTATTECQRAVQLGKDIHQDVSEAAAIGTGVKLQQGAFKLNHVIVYDGAPVL